MRCKECGRAFEGGRETHWIGCDTGVTQILEGLAGVENTSSIPESLLCHVEGCSNPKRPALRDYGRRPKYCKDHDPKKKRSEAVEAKGSRRKAAND